MLSFKKNDKTSDAHKASLNNELFWDVLVCDFSIICKQCGKKIVN